MKITIEIDTETDVEIIELLHKLILLLEKQEG